jgi:predicted nucleotidyltransferase
LFSHPDERYFVRQLTGLVKEDSTNVSRELARLERTGILISTAEGKQKYYQANRESPLFDELHGLILKTAGVADILRSSLSSAQEQIAIAFIYGSIAGGNEMRKSDIDVMVIGKIPFEQVISLLSPAEEKLNREVNPVVYSAAEFRKKAREGHHFVNTVLEERKIFLIGDDGEFAKLAGERADKSP